MAKKTTIKQTSPSVWVLESKEIQALWYLIEGFNLTDTYTLSRLDKAEQKLFTKKLTAVKESKTIIIVPGFLA